jgi:tetratricopeptide (TPR) repeat protein
MEEISNLEKQAVEEALNLNWKQAIKLNLKIIKIDKKNLDAYLRLAFACLQLNKIEEAQRYYKKVLKIQPNNNTALENLNRIKILMTKKQKKITEKPINLDPNLFLDIPGRTKSIALVDLGQKNTLAQLSVGEKVKLKIRRRRVEIRTQQNDYIGHLPDDLSKRLLILIKSGSEFSGYIKEAALNRVVVFLKEEKRGKKVAKYFPFPINLTGIKAEEILSTEKTDDSKDEESLELTDADLEQLAEMLASEEKEEYLPFSKETQEEEVEE